MRFVAPQHREFRDKPELWHTPIVMRSARVEDTAPIEFGVEKHTFVGEHCWLMHGVIVGHDVTIKRGCEIATGTIVGAHSVLEPDVRLGVGTVVRPRTKIGKGARTGCGTVVTKDIPDGETWVGNPARPLRTARQAEVADEWLNWFEDTRHEVPIVGHPCA